MTLSISPKELDELENNFQRLSEIEPKKQLQSGGRGTHRLYVDRRWFYSNVTLQPADLRWTFDTFGELKEKCKQLDPKVDANVKLIELVSKIDALFPRYIAKLSVLKQTYESLSDGKKVAEELGKLLSEFPEVKPEEAKQEVKKTHPILKRPTFLTKVPTPDDSLKKALQQRRHSMRLQETEKIQLPKTSQDDSPKRLADTQVNRLEEALRNSSVLERAKTFSKREE